MQTQALKRLRSVALTVVAVLAVAVMAACRSKHCSGGDEPEFLRRVTVVALHSDSLATPHDAGRQRRLFALVVDRSGSSVAEVDRVCRGGVADTFDVCLPESSMLMRLFETAAMESLDFSDLHTLRLLPAALTTGCDEGRRIVGATVAVNPAMDDTLAVRLRPVTARYEIVARKGSALAAAGLTVRVDYRGYHPSAFDLDRWEAVSSTLSAGFVATSVMRADSSAVLAFDHCIIFGDPSTAAITVTVADASGAIVAGPADVDVALRRGRNTIVTDSALAAGSQNPGGGGIGVNPSFAGEFNIFLP